MELMKRRLQEIGAKVEAGEEIADGSRTELLVVYGSETGTAEAVARRFAKNAKQRGCVELNDVCYLPSQSTMTIVACVATCGDGETP